MSSPRYSPVLLRCAGLAFTVAFLLAAGLLRGQEDVPSASSEGSSAGEAGNPSEPGESGVEGLNRAARLPPNSFSQYDPTGLPYSSVPLLERTGGDFNNAGSMGGSPLSSSFWDPAKVGNAEGGIDIFTGNLGSNFPFAYTSAEPQNADIKAGPIYIKFHSLDGLTLYDDNFRHTTSDRKSEVLALLSLNLSVIAQLTDNLQFQLTGSIMYLPLQNQVGIETNAYNNLGLFLYGVPGLAAQMAYDTMIGGWPVVFADDFRANVGTYSNNVRDNFDLFRGDYLDENENGSYAFRSQQNQGTSTTTTSNADTSIPYFSNDMSAVATRLLPDDVRLTVHLDHENLWYNQDNRGLPSGRDEFFTALASERPNLRFKPYAVYEVTNVEGRPDGLVQSAQLGIRGPIDDQLLLRMSAGYFLSSGGASSYLYLFALDHTAGPYTLEQLVVDRSLSTFVDETVTSEYYNLRQILGPTLVGSVFLAHAQFAAIGNQGGSNHSDYYGGAQLDWQLGPKTDLLVAGVATREDYSGGSRIDRFTGRITLNRIVTDSLTFQLLYQYQRSIANNAGQSYYENLVYFRFVKTFD